MCRACKKKKMAKTKKKAKNINVDFSKVNLQRAATRTGGNAVGGIGTMTLTRKVIPSIVPDQFEDKVQLIGNGISGLLGTVLDEGVLGDGDFITSLGQGMRTIAITDLVLGIMPESVKQPLGLTGINGLTDNPLFVDEIGELQGAAMLNGLMDGNVQRAATVASPGGEKRQMAGIAV